jgi:hypothetical protein
MRDVTDPDPHGQAALMLCEGLILLLIERGLINKIEAIDVVEGVIEVKREIAETSGSVVVSVTSINVLKNVLASISAAPIPEDK